MFLALVIWPLSMHPCLERGRTNVSQGGRCTHVMHGRSRVNIDPRITTYDAGTEYVGVFTDQAGIACTNKLEAG